jgi:hypothetical protein
MMIVLWDAHQMVATSGKIVNRALPTAPLPSAADGSRSRSRRGERARYPCLPRRASAQTEHRTSSRPASLVDFVVPAASPVRLAQHAEAACATMAQTLAGGWRMNRSSRRRFCVRRPVEPASVMVPAASCSRSDECQSRRHPIVVAVGHPHVVVGGDLRVKPG